MTADASAPRTSLLAAAALVAASFVVTLLLGEIAIRPLHPSASLWRFPNYIEQVTRPDPHQPAELLRYDSVLGWEPQPGASGILMHQPVSYSDNGLRNQNKTLELGNGRPILAVGDSYTLGYAVKDDETWPANLERQLQQRAPVRHGHRHDHRFLRGDHLRPRPLSRGAASEAVAATQFFTGRARGLMSPARP